MVFTGFNRHDSYRGKHAILSPSKHYWTNYTDEKLHSLIDAQEAIKHGTEMHDLARRLIENGIELRDEDKTFNLYVNDAIKYKMTPEQVLYYSDNCFGSADAIAYSRKKLRIHDLKTGVTPANIVQLRIYAALFCLEYSMEPYDIKIELRIYQNDEVIVDKPSPDEISDLMDIIIHSDRESERYMLNG